MFFLAGDIGGTNTRLLLGETQGDSHWRKIDSAVYPSQDYASFDTLLAGFLATTEQPQVACLGVAGPVKNQQTKITHLPWLLDSNAICSRFNIAHTCLLNDFEVQAYALPSLPAHNIHTLQQGDTDDYGVKVLIGAGTGVGMATIVHTGNHQHPPWQVIPSEGGHADFAPADHLQMELWQSLHRHQARVSIEHVLSGNGLENIYRFFVETTAKDRPLLPAAGITTAAMQGDALAIDAINLFVEIYGAQAGNLALINMARGGVYVTGGIAPKILPFLRQGRFMQAFLNKQPKRELLESMPVYITLDEDLGLAGAATVAASMKP